MSDRRTRLDTFVAPKPSARLIGAMGWLNRLVMLHGIPLLRDIPPFNWIPGFRGLANIRRFGLPAADRMRLAELVGPGQATFFTPNHPEFFTDWMIDKEILSRTAPLCACWATNGIVNGMGGLAQRFWLANNLIAQIPGNNAAARKHSVDWALAGNGVLLHPEGAVGWHGDWVAPLMPGAAEMASEALDRGRVQDPAFKAWIAPIVWKLVFTRDVERGLGSECRYIERRLKLGAERGLTSAQRVFRIYDMLLARDADKAGIAMHHGTPFATRHAALVSALSDRLAALLPPSDERGDLLRRAGRYLRAAKDGPDPARADAIRGCADTIQRLRRLGPFAWRHETITQEHVAEHIKRIRNDYCKGTLRDTLNALIPQPVGPRNVIVRAAEPIALHAFAGSSVDATAELRTRLQAALDAVNADPANRSLRTYPNPFLQGRSGAPATDP